MTDASDIASVAQGLTKAQRVLIAAMPEEWVAHGFFTEKLIASGGAIATSLLACEVTERQRFLRPGRAHDRYRLTPLGLAVRDHLRAGGA